MAQQGAVRTFFVGHNIAQSHRISRTINIFYRTICPLNPHNLNFFSRTLSDALLDVTYMTYKYVLKYIIMYLCTYLITYMHT